MADSPRKNIEITFSTTNNPWVNNGLTALVQGLKTDFEDKIRISTSHGHVTISGDDKVHAYIAQTLHNLAATGTYNFSTSFKIINEACGSTYTPPKDYPNKKGERKKTIDIQEHERAELKRQNITDTKKNQQIWKMRLSYLGSEDNYLKIGLNLYSDPLYKRIIHQSAGKDICPVCGMPTNILEDVKSFFNPFAGEHHNNVLDGYSYDQKDGFRTTDIRRSIKCCPKCTLLSYISLFDHHVPFYSISNKGVYLAIPVTPNLETLMIIGNNLSLPSNHIDFSKPTVKSYGTNIKSLRNRTPSAALLALLHNIVNRYSVEPTEITLIPVTRERFRDIVDWAFIEKNRYSITYIKAHERVYDLVSPQRDPKSQSEVYLVPDVLYRLSFYRPDEYLVERFHYGLLTLNHYIISETLFRLTKSSISEKNAIYMSRPIEGHSTPLKLFSAVFLPKFMEVSMTLDDEIKAACDSVARTVGKGFCTDVGMMTKFAYASNATEFKSALADASFRLAKKTALDDSVNYYLNDKSMRQLMDSLEQEEFHDIKNYFISFMSVYAITANYYRNKPEGKGD